MSARLDRERRTIAAMIALHCRRAHGTATLCPVCADLHRYAQSRLDHCPYTVKPTCARCPIHCYRPDRREQVRAVMRSAGPWMLWYHPWLTLRHWVDAWNPPVR